MSKAEDREELQHIHYFSYGDNKINLCRRLHRQSYIALKCLRKLLISGGCEGAREPLDMGESVFVQEAGDWRQPYLEFFQHCVLPTNRFSAMKIQRKSLRFFEVKDLSFRRRLPSASQGHSRR